jgi:hypothetical protein
MSDATSGKRPADDGPGEEDQDHRLQREREKAGPGQHDDATGPGYTARPSEEGPEPGHPGAGKG